MQPFAPTLLVLLAGLLSNCVALRTGAPSLACVNLRPIHGLNRAKPASASQFFVTQSTLAYEPGQNVSVDIVTHSEERYFRGFMIQAYDPISGRQQGNFVAQEDAKPLDGCSAATHRDNLNKKHVTLTWVPPGTNPVTSQPTSSFGDIWAGLRPLTSFGLSANKRSLDSNLQAPEQQGASSSAPSGPSQPGPVSRRQVRFRATIVVTYEEFYTGFESSDQRFERFDYASSEKAKPTHEAAPIPAPADPLDATQHA